MIKEPPVKSLVYKGGDFEIHLPERPGTCDVPWASGFWPYLSGSDEVASLLS